jgi:hypothetical protein
MVPARSPAREAAVIWSRISASSGDTTSVGPLPRSRRDVVAAQYTADFPQPVACTTNTRFRCSTSSSTARTWSSRGRASGPATAAMVRTRAAAADPDMPFSSLRAVRTSARWSVLRF